MRSEGFGEVVCVVMSVGVDEVGGGSGRSRLPWGAAPTEGLAGLVAGKSPQLMRRLAPMMTNPARAPQPRPRQP